MCLHSVPGFVYVMSFQTYLRHLPQLGEEVAFHLLFHASSGWPGSPEAWVHGYKIFRAVFHGAQRLCCSLKVIFISEPSIYLFICVCVMHVYVCVRCVCMCVCVMCVMYVCTLRTTWRNCPLPPCESQGVNSGCQAWPQVPWLAEPSCWSRLDVND